MIATPTTIELPLRTDESGVIHVGNTRVTLDSVVADFHRNGSPEAIVENFPVLKVADIYKVIGYYLENQGAVDAYIQQQREANEQIRREWEADHPPKITKADLLARLEAQKKSSGEA